MNRVLKRVINGVLAQMNLRISRVEFGSVNGINLYDDLRLLIKNKVSDLL